MSTIRFALVCLVFVLFYYFTPAMTILWLGIPLLSDLFHYLHKLDASCQPTMPAPKPITGYDAVKDAFEEIFATI